MIYFVSFLKLKSKILSLTINHFTLTTNPSSLISKLALILLFAFNISNAQTFPVQISTQLVPPYSGYLPDYADPTAQNLKVILQFNDFTQPSYNLKLKFEIKGNGFSLVTKAFYNPPPITLEPGQPLLLSGTDLAPYLSSNNLDFIGINQNQYEQRMALPEGYYSICVTAYDYYTGNPTKVSNEACAQGWFTLSNPPLLNLPLCNTVVNPLDPQNLLFSWTPVNLGSPNSSFNTSYLFELWEMRPDSTVNPNQLVQNTQPIYSQITNINNLNYGIAEPPLNLYYKYAWRVKVIDGSGKDWFINNGYSQVCTFYYGSIGNTLGNAVNLNLQAEATDYVSGIATWTLQNFYTTYQLDVKEASAQEWTTYTTTTNSKQLQNLEPNKTYECRVKGFGNGINSNFSNTVSFTTPTPPNINLQAEALDYITGRASWGQQNAYNTFQLEVRKKNTPNWFPYNTTANNQQIDNLEGNKTYECRIKGFGDNYSSNYSNIAEFTTPGPPIYNCNQAAPIYSVNTTPLPLNRAVTGLTVRSGQFDVVIKHISSGTMGAGYYTGSGYAMMFGILPIPVTFTNVFIDDKQRQQQGIIHAVTKGMKNWMQQFDIEDAEENATYVNGTLDSVYINNGQYCYTTLESPTPICTPIDTTKLPLVIRDGEGNQYVINEGPPPTVTGPTSYLNLSNDNLAATDNLKVQFSASPNQTFGFDSKEYPAFTEEYECIKLSNGKNYFVANKSVGTGINQNDKVIATYTIQNFNAAQLSFKTKGGGTLIKTSLGANTNSYEVSNIPANADCIYAYYNNQKIGKLNIVSLNKISKKVVLVSVNGASNSITQQQLNNVYKQANTNFTLTTAPNFTFDLGNDGLEAADANLFNKYSPEMRALRDAFKQKDSLYDKNAYYIFVVPNFSNPSVKGYMARGRAVGFLSSNATATDLAHELGHGAFKLEHTFPKQAQGTSNNLMDYNGGTHLTKSQWLNIQNPTTEITWFDEEEDGSMGGSLEESVAKMMTALKLKRNSKGRIVPPPPKFKSSFPTNLDKNKYHFVYLETDEFSEITNYGGYLYLVFYNASNIGAIQVQATDFVEKTPSREFLMCRYLADVLPANIKGKVGLKVIISEWWHLMSVKYDPITEKPIVNDTLQAYIDNSDYAVGVTNSELMAGSCLESAQGIAYSMSVLLPATCGKINTKFNQIKSVQQTSSVFKVGGNIIGKIIIRVRSGTNGKIAVIGRKMDGHVNDVVSHLQGQGKQVEAFSESFQANKTYNIDGQTYSWKQIKDDFANPVNPITGQRKYASINQQGWIADSDIPNTLMYKANRQWANNLVNNGFEIIDMGFPAGQNLGPSLFYNMELSIIFPK